MSEQRANLDPGSKTGSLLLARARPEDARAWDEFVDRHPEGRFCYLWGYRRALEEAYGYRCVYLNILADGQRLGVFPSIAVRGISGRLVSQPFNEYGGPLTQGLSHDEQSRLPSLLMRVAQEEGCQGIEIRGGIGCEAMAGGRYCVRVPLYSYAILRLDEKEKLWRKALTNEARKGVKKAQTSGLSVEVYRGVHAVQDPFYRFYLISMKRLGVPPHPKRFFDELAAGLGDRLVAAWVSNQTSSVAFLVGAISGQRIQIYITASDPEAWSMRPNDLAHWELINWAYAQGLRVFDFGSARYSGQIQFKKKWGVSLHDYSCYMVSSSDSAASRKIQTVDSSSKLMLTMANLWRWMVPVPVTRLLGRPIRRYLTK